MNIIDKPVNLEYVKRLNNVLVYIENNLNDEITLDTLSSVSNFSKFHFLRLFKSIIGETPLGYIKRLRLEKAAILLKHQKNENILNIAFLTGYSDLSIFSRTFSKHFRVSPSMWRKLKLKNSNIGQIAPKIGVYFCLTNKKYLNMEQLLKSEVKELPKTK